MDGKYIYGIVDSSHDIAPDLIGLGGGPVHKVSHQGISGVVSDYSGEDFRSVPKEPLVRFLLRHQLVIEAVMTEGGSAVLPVKFGTLLDGSDEVLHLLRQGQHLFRDALTWFNDKVEMEVAATWDMSRVLKEVATEPAIVQARDTVPTGQPTLEERIRLGQVVKATLDGRRDRYRERMMDFLKDVVVDKLPNALVSDDLVMNVAFLVNRQVEFDERVSQLNDLFQNQIDFRIIGPLPPYSFATVEVTKPNRERMEEARQLLGLGTVISEAEVKKAYRHRAAKAHPDHNPGGEMSKTRFAQLRRASELLIAYSRGQTGGNGSLLINMRRQGTELQHVHFGPLPSFG
ncbi:MAG: GvpL/GvpF family gas vesicle protein [Chloroflexi bacterium]|nr:GvpL/GvpF family gas vesicle protein [Chloroflexota bacterium]